MRGGSGRGFWSMAYALGAVTAGTNIASPLYNVYEMRFGFSPLALTAVFTIYIVVIVPGLLVFGPLADAVGRRPVLAGAIMAGVAASLVLAGATDLKWLFAGRILEGVSFAAAIGTGAAALVEAHPRRDHRVAAAVTTASFLGGSAVGTLMTGLLAQYGPRPLQLTYLVHAGLLLLALLLVGLAQEPLPAADRRPWRLGRPAIPSAATVVFLRGTGAAMAAATCGAVYLALAASYATQLLGTGNLAVIGAIVGLFLASGALSQVVLRPAAPWTVAAFGLASVGIGMGLGAVAGPVHSIAVLALGSALAGAGQGITFRGTLSMISPLAPASARADLASAFYAAIYASTGAAAIALGVLATALSLAAAIPPVAGAIAVLTLLLAAAIARRVPQPVPGRS